MQSCCRVNTKTAIQVQFLEHSMAYKRGREELQPPNIQVYQFFSFICHIHSTTCSETYPGRS